MYALSHPKIAPKLDGQLIFFATPAEEYGEAEFKNQLIAAGEITYGGGKCELLRIGAFDNVDAALAHHIEPEGLSAGNGNSNGFVAKVIRIKGKAAQKTDRSFKAGALALGAGYRIETTPGYLPSLPQAFPDELIEGITEAAGKAPRIVDLSNHSAGSTDVGDVQHLLPVLTFHTGGVTGGLHQNNFSVVDEDEAYVLTAKIFALSAYCLLKDGAALGRKLKEEYQPVFKNKEEYIKFLDLFHSVEEG